jgi:hypothetical protein
MRATEIAARLEGFRARGAGTDSERRAANWLADELAASGREVAVDTFWCRPNWALAHSWHVALALAGSLLAVASATLGGALVLASLVSILADEVLGVSLGRRLTPERASQNVIATPRDGPAPAERGGRRVRLVIASNYDAGRTGLAYRDGIRSATARLRRATFGLTPGWLGWLSIADLWLLGTAVVRATGEDSRAIGAVQLPPTVALVLGLALLIELALAGHSPAAGDNGSGVAVALTLARALDIAPPRNLDVEVVLGGAGDGSQIGIRHYLRDNRRERKPRNTVVIGIAACSGGAPRWWTTDGSLFPARFARPLRQLAAEVAADEAYLKAAAHTGRDTTPAWPARRRRLPALTIGCLNPNGLIPRSHHRSDTADQIDPAAIENAVQFGLILVDAADAFVRFAAAGAPTPA